MKIAVCPGSFDPVTIGHIDVITRASKLFDQVIVLALINPLKKPCFTAEERIDMLRRATSHLSNIEVDAADCLLAAYMRQKQATVIVKGLRAVTDFEYEFQMALINQKLNHEIDTIFLTAQADNMYLSSSLVKEVGGFGGDITDFVPECVLQDVLKKIRK